MIKLFLLLVLSKLTTTESSFDPSKINYCNLTCPDNHYENVACQCYMDDKIVEITEQLVEFRTAILRKHNELRNRVGNGTEKRIKGAANINALSYDLELEYVARCSLTKAVGFPRVQECSRTSKFEKPGKIVGRNVVVPDTSIIVSKLVEGEWYDLQLNQIKQINPYNKSNRNVRELSELLWWSHTHMGCARILTTNPLYIMLCNYGGAGSSRIDKVNVYEEGEACSKCFKNRTCNSEYKGLCGEISPIPTDQLVPIPRRKNSKYDNVTKSGALTFRTTHQIFIVLNIIVLLY